MGDGGRSTPGPAPRPRRKVLVSMLEEDAEDFEAWADEEAVTKAELFCQMMARERVRRRRRRFTK